MKTNGIRLYSTKNGWTFPWFSWSFTVGVKKYSFWCPPKWLISFHIVLKKWFFYDFFKLTEGYPHDWCRRTMRKTYFAMKTNGIRWCSSKKGCIVFKKMSFSSSPKVTPATGVVEQWKKTALQRKPMELGGVPQKWMNLPLVFMAFHGQCQKI